MQLKPSSARLSALLVLLAAAGYWALEYHRPPSPPPAPIWIAHALGGIDGLSYTNSREAFLHNYALGFRLFEIDLSLTDDGQVCAFHTTQGPHTTQPSAAASSAAEQPEAEVIRHFNPLCLDGLSALISTHPDARFIIDIKEPAPQLGISPLSRQQAFQAIYRLLHERWQQPAERAHWQSIIPQIYAEQDLLFLQSLQDFSCVIHTLYRQSHRDAEVLHLMERHPEIRAVAVDRYRFNRELAATLSTQHRHVLIHTLNDPGVIHAFHLSGASGFYTDFHPPLAMTQPSPVDQAPPAGVAAGPNAVSNLCGSRTE